MSNGERNDNPFSILIGETENDVRKIQERYERHRRTRNTQQKGKLLDEGFPGFSLDPILQRLEDPSIEPGFVDPRSCVVLWGRPTEAISEMIRKVQARLRATIPDLWLMPTTNLHITVMEIAHSKTEAEIAELQDKLGPIVETLTDYSFEHRVQLIRPTVSYDSSALALSLLPASPDDKIEQALANVGYTYHHLRKDVWDICKACGIDIAGRYIVPSAHLTIGRFITQQSFLTSSMNGDQLDHAKIEALISTIEEINLWLQKEYWPEGNDLVPASGVWNVGQEKGLQLQVGKLWYGGGRTVRVGASYNQPT